MNCETDLALLIARTHEYLVSERDGDDMTALQLLACNPSAFRCGRKHRFLKKIINPFKSCCRVPLWEPIWEKKQRCESALRLAEFLIERDASWEATESNITRLKTCEVLLCYCERHLLLFERVEKIMKSYFIKHFNSRRQTAEKLFEENNAELRKDAKEWLKRTAESCSIIGVLIATVAFTSAYTIPGGPNQNTGYPILLSEPLFVIFTMTGCAFPCICFDIGDYISLSPLIAISFKRLQALSFSKTNAWSYITDLLRVL
ncbi:hypothetical protein F0562_014405 [Nyssa sinensis]|uniref:PGG domain-containing protein n=1 Tax=Nyssa sinensis TaxID=561372 RepID=A0A5J4ZQ78_9ASTE|nr:hypothetical protein F0562_014405 [Nyssa sinensis]